MICSETYTTVVVPGGSSPMWNGSEGDCSSYTDLLGAGELHSPLNMKAEQNDPFFGSYEATDVLIQAPSPAFSDPASSGSSSDEEDARVLSLHVPMYQLENAHASDQLPSAALASACSPSTSSMSVHEDRKPDIAQLNMWTTNTHSSSEPHVAATTVSGHATSSTLLSLSSPSSSTSDTAASSAVATKGRGRAKGRGRGAEGPAANSPRRHHACTWCPKRFVTTGHLKQHVRIHTGDRPFKCNYCTKRFAQCGDLKRHERIHTGEKPFECKTCGKSFAQCGNLSKHERTHLKAAKSKSASTKVKAATVTSLSPVLLPLPKLACNIDGPARIASPTATQVTAAAAAATSDGAGTLPLGGVLDLNQSESAAARVKLLESQVARLTARDRMLMGQLDETRLQLATLQATHDTLLAQTHL